VYRRSLAAGQYITRQQLPMTTALKVNSQNSTQLSINLRGFLGRWSGLCYTEHLKRPNSNCNFELKFSTNENLGTFFVTAVVS